MIDKKAIEVKRAKKIIARIFQARAIIIFLICFPLIGLGAVMWQFQNDHAKIFAGVLWSTALLYLFSLIPYYLGPKLLMLRMIKRYALDAEDHKELIRRLKVLSEIIRIDLFFEGKITLWKIAKESRITKIDVEPFKECKYFKVANENIHEIVCNDIFTITFKRYIPIINLWYMQGDHYDMYRIQGTLEEVTGVDINKWRKSKRKKYGQF